MNYIAIINSFWDSATTNPLSTGQVSLYFALLHICNRSNWTEWFAAPNQVLSVLTGLSRSGILKARNELKQRGLIDFREKGTKATLYKVLTIANSTQVSAQDSTQNGVQIGTQDSTQNGVQKSNTLYKHKQKLKQKSVSDDTPEKCALNSLSGEVLEAFRGYMDYRKSIGAAMTDRAVQLAVNKLNELAPGNPSVQVAIINQSVLNGWKGLFALKDVEQKSPQKGSTSNTFHNFHQREVDYDALLAARMQQEGKDGGDNQKMV